MKLYIVRHGDALPRERDPDCPLSARGRADAERLAERMSDERLRSDLGRMELYRHYAPHAKRRHRKWPPSPMW